MNNFSKIAAVAKKIIQFFKNKHIPRQVLKIQLDQTSHETALLTVSETGWSSLCDSLESLFKNKDHIQAAIFDKNISRMQELTNVKSYILNYLDDHDQQLEYRNDFLLYDLLLYDLHLAAHLLDPKQKGKPTERSGNEKGNGICL